ncbi:LysM peptidoglycan-binding domain-containing protein [Phytoactinopolyspora halotolerans]|uniref:LysM peptidoglycan-binding domain-containing protein n=1 Tax=Phytoactinopolyspora halotolerans TaxID=1981512 RepID=UPI001C206505|nr:LysM peptidoglycan-binding domain-containing protein [Phytoactinopolyspora halotolerans]
MVAALWMVLVALAALPIVQYVGGTSAEVETVRVEVQPGDTLWQLAREVDPDGDPRAVVDAIMGLNGLTSGADIRPGDTLTVPAEGR